MPQKLPSMDFRDVHPLKVVPKEGEKKEEGTSIKN